MKFKESRYNYAQPVDDKFLIYNLSSDAIAVLDADSYKQLSNLENAELLEDFIAIGFAIPEDVDEVALVNSRRLATMFGDYEEKNFTILPTTGCNARCFYCYEDGWEAQSMNSATALATAEFIERECQPNKRANIVWFGGEPLLGIDSIRTISDELDRRMEGRYSATMVSNGYLLTPEIIKESVERWKLSSVQIALDGIGELYEKRKAYSNGISNAFEHVMRNVEHALEAELKITARINVDKDNASYSEETIAYLAERFGKYDGFDAYFYPLQKVNGKPSEKFFTEEEYTLMMSELLTLRHQYGFLNNLDYALYPTVNAGCSARTLSSYVVDPMGQLYKCQHIMEDACIGTVFDGPRFNKAYATFCDPSLSEECSECIFFPKCHGGCVIHKLYGNRSCPKCQMIKYDIARRCELLYNIGVDVEA